MNICWGGEGEGENQHLRIENRGVSLHHSDRLIERGDRVCLPVLVRHHGREVQQQILRLQLRREPVLDALLLAGRDGDVLVARSGEVADDLRGRRRGGRVGQGPEGAANEDDVDGRGLVVGDGEDGEGGDGVDELYAENLGGGEGGGDLDGKGGGLGR